MADAAARRTSNRSEANALLDGVSRETRARLGVLVEALGKWQRIKNLVGPKTLDDVWTRHVADSLQLVELGRPGRWLDLGSGAGFPGLVVAIAMMEHGEGEVELVEANQRKAAFLREVIRLTGAPARVHAERAELALPRLAEPIAVVTARAFAPLAQLCDYAFPFVDKGAIALFPKGQDVDAELTEATRFWKMSLDRIGSKTEPNATILRIHGLTRITPSA